MNSTYLMGADPKDFDRSSVARNIFSLAHKNNMVFAHYEYRWPVPSPEAWLREDHGQGEIYWENGVLAELKYQSFRHDSSVCNFHPGQSSKWGAHELCHKLVGYAWKENADLLFHVLAAWTAEILPVTVYYFWDEVDCHKCEKHEDFSHSPISYCHDCEDVSRTRSNNEGVPRTGSNSEEVSRTHPNKDRGTDLIQKGWDFLNEQLRAVEKSLKEQRLVTAPYYHLDLADDAYFYIQQQTLRLNSSTYVDYMVHVPKNSMYVNTVEDLIHRVRQVAKAIMGEARLEPLGITKEKWVSLDVGFRGLELAEVLEGEAQK